MERSCILKIQIDIIMSSIFITILKVVHGLCIKDKTNIVLNIKYDAHLENVAWLAVLSKNENLSIQHYWKMILLCFIVYWDSNYKTCTLPLQFHLKWHSRSLSGVSLNRHAHHSDMQRVHLHQKRMQMETFQFLAGQHIYQVCGCTEGECCFAISYK